MKWYWLKYRIKRVFKWLFRIRVVSLPIPPPKEIYYLVECENCGNFYDSGYTQCKKCGHGTMKVYEDWSVHQVTGKTDD